MLTQDSFSDCVGFDTHKHYCLQSCEQVFGGVESGERCFRIWSGKQACREYGGKVLQVIPDGLVREENCKH